MPRVPTTTTRPRPAGPEEPPRVRADIIEAATRVFSERGYHAASMSEIAEIVGIRKPSLYHHVRKKEDLLFAIHEQLIDELTAETAQAVDAEDDPGRRLDASVRVALRFIARNRDAVTVFLHERRELRGDRWTELVRKRDAYERMVRDTIVDGIAAGRFVDVSPTIAAKALLGMANWGYTWLDPKGPLSADDVADVFADILLRGLETR